MMLTPSEVPKVRLQKTSQCPKYAKMPSSGALEYHHVTESTSTIYRADFSSVVFFVCSYVHMLRGSDINQDYMK
jgi:hypothetical protein